MCTSRRSVSSSVLLAKSFFTSTRLFTSTAILRSTRRRNYMHQHPQPLSSSPFAPVDLQAFPTVESFQPPLVPPAAIHAAPPPSPRGCIVPLMADCFPQLSGGLVITPRYSFQLPFPPSNASSRLPTPSWASTPDAHPAPHCTGSPRTAFSQPAPWILRCSLRH